MADAVSIDASEVLALAKDIAGTQGRIVPEMRASVSRGALNVKKAMQADLAASRSFKGIASSVSYDLTGNNTFSQAEVGPSAESGSPGNLANIAYFGGSRGGGTVRDPAKPLEEEAPRFYEAIEALAGKVLE
jgi:hypothetical protein